MKYHTTWDCILLSYGEPCGITDEAARHVASIYRGALRTSYNHRESFAAHALASPSPSLDHPITMKSFFVALVAIASTATAHYTFPELIVGSTHTGQWNYVRKTANYQSNGTVLINNDNRSSSTNRPRPRDRCHIQRHPLLRARPGYPIADLHSQRR
jgi:hypothetical protein